jgi:hypothetical protein
MPRLSGPPFKAGKTNMGPSYLAAAASRRASSLI